MCAYLVSEWICKNHTGYLVSTKTIECNLSLCCVWFHINTRKYTLKVICIMNLKKLRILVFDGRTFALVSIAKTIPDIDL